MVTLARLFAPRAEIGLSLFVAPVHEWSVFTDKLPARRAQPDESRYPVSDTTISSQTHLQTDGAEPQVDGVRPLNTSMRRGFCRHCPNCGQGHLFVGYLKVVDHCTVCREDLTPQRADDGPAYLTVLIVGHILAVLLHFGWRLFRPDPLLFAALMVTLGVGLSLWLLPRFKGMIVGIQWAKRMHGFSRD